MFLFVLFGCVEDTDTAEEVATLELAPMLAEQLSGHFDSSEQAASNSAYYAVSLKACDVEAPEFGSEVLYVEQALLSDLNAPYRQRLYVVEQLDDDTVQSTIYSLINEDSAIGLCDRSETVSFTSSDVTLRQGCHVTLEWNGTGFAGATEENSCESSLNGASYATSLVETTPSVISSWDQGRNSMGEQVWGAVDGPYIFSRQ